MQRSKTVGKVTRAVLTSLQQQKSRPLVAAKPISVRPGVGHVGVRGFFNMFDSSQQNAAKSGSSGGSSWFSSEQEPIKYETTAIIPFDQEEFYHVIRDVERYQEFVPFMTSSEVREDTHVIKKKNGVVHGKFDAETTIGFQGLVNFSYVSRVSYKHPSYVLSVSGQQAEGSVSAKIFSELYSLWEIEQVSEGKSRIKYKLQMTFANSMYSAITRQFFDFLAMQMQDSFQERCKQLSKMKAKQQVKKEKVQVEESPLQEEGMLANFHEDHQNLNQCSQVNEETTVFPDSMSEKERVALVKEKERQRAKLAELNLQEEILSSINEVQKLQAESHGSNYGFEQDEVNLREIYLEMVNSNDKLRLREAEMLFHTFYEGGSEFCKHQYARHMNRLLLETQKL